MGRFVGKASSEVLAALDAAFNTFLLQVQQLIAERELEWVYYALDAKEKFTGICNEASQDAAKSDQTLAEVLRVFCVYLDQDISEIENARQILGIISEWRKISPGFVLDQSLRL